MFNNRLFNNINPSAKLSGLLLAAGIILLLFSLIYALIVTGRHTSVLSALYELMTGLSRRLGAVPENDSKAYWYISRAAGITAYILLSVTVIFGLTITNKIIKTIEKLPSIYELHNILAVSSFLMALLHALILLGDDYIRFSWFTLLIPFASPFRPLWVGWGVIGFYFMILTIISFYLRGLITFKGWRIWHYTTFLTWTGVSVHGIWSGTDTPTWSMRIIYALSITAVITLLTIRLIKTFRQKSRKHPSSKYVRIDDCY